MQTVSDRYATRPTAAPNRLLKLQEVRALTGVSRSAIYEWAKDGNFPRPRRLSPHTRRVGWLQHEIQEWIESRPIAA
jgi:prophage regulatory protein